MAAPLPPFNLQGHTFPQVTYHFDSYNSQLVWTWDRARQTMQEVATTTATSAAVGGAVGTGIGVVSQLVKPNDDDEKGPLRRVAEIAAAGAAFGIVANAARESYRVYSYTQDLSALRDASEQSAEKCREICEVIFATFIGDHNQYADCFDTISCDLLIHPFKVPCCEKTFAYKPFMKSFSLHGRCWHCNQETQLDKLTYDVERHVTVLNLVRQALAQLQGMLQARNLDEEAVQDLARQVKEAPSVLDNTDQIVQKIRAQALSALEEALLCNFLQSMFKEHNEYVEAAHKEFVLGLADDLQKSKIDALQYAQASGYINNWFLERLVQAPQL